MHKILNKYIQVSAISFMALALLPVEAADLSITFTDSDDKPVKEVVVYLTAADGQVFKSIPQNAIVDQIDKKFVQRVKVISVGSQVDFPNKDNIHHHVYSFSEAKKFELPLYKGTEAMPVTFDKTGVVSLGCNIHDWMKGYIVVVDSPYYALSNTQGDIRISDLPTGKYKLNIWHPESKTEFSPEEIELNSSDTLRLEKSVALKTRLSAPRAPRSRNRRY